MASSSRTRTSGPVLPISPSRRFCSSKTTTSSSSSSAFSSQSAPFLHRSSSPLSRRRVCLCSPTAHQGSFRCNLHNNVRSTAVSSPSNRLNARRSAMVNSLVRIGTAEGDSWMRKCLAALMRPSSHQQRRRTAFQPRPSRLSAMSTAPEDGSS